MGIHLRIRILFRKPNWVYKQTKKTKKPKTKKQKITNNKPLTTTQLFTRRNDLTHRQIHQNKSVVGEFKQIYRVIRGTLYWECLRWQLLLPNKWGQFEPVFFHMQTVGLHLPGSYSVKSWRSMLNYEIR